MLENPSATDAMRIDYFSIMRKWHCALYRYGLRLTYDITVPEPGAAMREIYAQLDALQNSAGEQFVFDITHAHINTDNYLALGDNYYVDVPPPPSPSNVVVQVGPVIPSTTDSIQPVTFNVPSGYWITSIILEQGIGKDSFVDDPFLVLGASPIGLTADKDRLINLCAKDSFLWHQSGSLSITVMFMTSKLENDGKLFFTVNCAPTETAMAQWQSGVWNVLYNAAQAKFYAKQQKIIAQIAALQAKLAGVDTLTLRREENDEIMKCAIRWIMGDDFAFMPQNVIDLFKKTGNEKYGIDFTSNYSGLDSYEESAAKATNDWSIATKYEDRVNFINQAVDWDNVIYFVYSYFWDDPQSWDFIRQIRHPDATRQAFLRAGSARIVLTVRPGWEKAWTYFVEFGGATSMPDVLPYHPYLQIAQQIQDYDAINYPGIPPADPNGGGPIDDGTPQVGTTCDVVLNPSAAPVTITVADNTGFVAGATAIIDTYESKVQEIQTITAVPENDKTHITVVALSNTHSPAQSQNKPYPIVQAGAAGTLIAEWFEYTPTSGTDIAVTSDLTTIA